MLRRPNRQEERKKGEEEKGGKRRREKEKKGKRTSVTSVPLVLQPRITPRARIKVSKRGVKVKKKRKRGKKREGRQYCVQFSIHESRIHGLHYMTSENSRWKGKGGGKEGKGRKKREGKRVSLLYCRHAKRGGHCACFDG